jgi:uncharacterized membrane protein HdeD (DUF308 family)
MTISLDAAAQVYREAVRQSVRKHANFHLVEAALLVVTGIFAALFPVVSSAAAVVTFGWLMVLTGLIQCLGLISARHAPNFWLQFTSALLAVLLGVLLLRNLGEGLLLLSLLMVVFLMIEGISKLVFAMTIRPLPSWIWMLISGCLSIALSLILLASMPVAALWLVGLILGINLIAIGLSLGALAWAVRQSAAG